MRELLHGQHQVPAHVEPLLDGIHDAQMLRLLVLKDDLEPIIASMWKPDLFFDLQIAPSESPRLWLDLVSSVVMAPDPRTYRLIQETDDREILFETRDRAEMAERICQYMAHGPVAQARHMTDASGILPRRNYSAGSLILAWLSGLVLGVLVLLTVGILYAD